MHYCDLESAVALAKAAIAPGGPPLALWQPTRRTRRSQERTPRSEAGRLGRWLMIIEPTLYGPPCVYVGAAPHLGRE